MHLVIVCEQAAQQVEELELRYEASQRHVTELNARLHTLADSLEEAHKQRCADDCSELIQTKGHTLYVTSSVATSSRTHVF
jgi:hypothetical protein